MLHASIDRELKSTVCQPRANALRQAETEADMDPAWLMRAVEYVRREYPHLADQQSVFLEEVAERAQVRQNGGTQAMPTSGAMPSRSPAASAASGSGKRGLLGWLFKGSSGGGNSDSNQASAR